jgi:hypothetical protein
MGVSFVAIHSPEIKDRQFIHTRDRININPGQSCFRMSRNTG